LPIPVVFAPAKGPTNTLLSPPVPDPRPAL
jgi:hypothetical protein